MLSLLSEKEQRTVDKAAKILERLAKYNSYTFTAPAHVIEYCRMNLRPHKTEQFFCLFLDSQHKLIVSEAVFSGTINSASVFCRPIVEKALMHNAAAVIFAHNHPSGDATPSDADIAITRRLKQALVLIDVTVLDHIVVGDNVVSFSNRGLI